MYAIRRYYEGVGHVAEEGVLVLVLHGVEKGDLRVLDEKGVVRGAERRAGVAVETGQITVIERHLIQEAVEEFGMFGLFPQKGGQI